MDDATGVVSLLAPHRQDEERASGGERLVDRVVPAVTDDRVDVFEQREGMLEFSGYLPSFVDELIAKKWLDPDVLFARRDGEESASR